MLPADDTEVQVTGKVTKFVVADIDNNTLYQISGTNVGDSATTLRKLTLNLLLNLAQKVNL